MVTRGYDIERFLIAGRNEGAAGLTLMEEFLLGHFAGFGMMADEDNLDVAITGRDELIEQEEEASRQILLHRVHRTRGVHDADDDGVGILADVGLEMFIAQVVLMEREAPFERSL